MLIECLIRREGGSVISLYGAEYRFTPDDKGRHVAQVNDDAAIDRLLCISEGYQEAPILTMPVVPVVPAVPVAPEKPVAVAAVLDRDALVTEYAILFGKKPHHKLSAEKLVELVAAAKEAAEADPELETDEAVKAAADKAEGADAADKAAEETA